MKSTTWTSTSIGRTPACGRTTGITRARLARASGEICNEAPEARAAGALVFLLDASSWSAVCTAMFP